MFVQLVGGRVVIGIQFFRFQIRLFYSFVFSVRSNCFRMVKLEVIFFQFIVVLFMGYRVLFEIVCCFFFVIFVGDVFDSDGKIFYRNEDSKFVNGFWIKIMIFIEYLLCQEFFRFFINIYGNFVNLVFYFFLYREKS